MPISGSLRIKPGTRLVRAWGGKVHTVTAVPRGFEYQGQRYRSLSAVARASPVTSRSNWANERIRDKIAASKKKGMWMGGFVPIGYQSKNRTLTIVEGEAKTVRLVFRLYLELNNVRLVEEELRRRGVTTKRYVAASGRTVGGQPFSRGHIYKLLSHPLYIGEIAHKGTRYPGQHPAIIDADTWQSV